MTVQEAKELKVGDVVYDCVSEMNWTVIMVDQFPNWANDCEVIIENAEGHDAHITKNYAPRFRKI
jgi:hypothetical protein